MLGDLNPQVKREAEQAREIAGMKGDIASIKDMLAKVLNYKNSLLLSCLFLSKDIYSLK